MELNIGDMLFLKKPHPCGGNRFLITRTGTDIKIKCQTCSHEIMVPRSKLVKMIKIGK